MKLLAFVLLSLVGSLMLTNLPAPSYADSNLDTLLRIATQARDNINIQLSQLPTVSDEINQLYKQGSEETNALAKSVSQEDQASSKVHFLSAMKIFKEVNDKISSLTPATASTQTPQVDKSQLKSEISRIQNLGNRLETIATTNNVEINFTKFNQIMQDAGQNLDAGNIDKVNKDLETANQLILDAHQLLADAATKKTTDRAKDFTEKQIQRLSQVNQTSQVSKNNLSQNITQSAPPTTPTPQINNASQIESIPSMVTQLKQLVSEGKINEALNLIKSIEVIQNQQANSQVPVTEPPNATQPANVNNINTTGIIKPVNNTTTSHQTNTTAPNHIVSPSSIGSLPLPTNTTAPNHIVSPSSIGSLPLPTNTTAPNHIVSPSSIGSLPLTTNKTASHTIPNTRPTTNSTTTPTGSTISLTVNSVDLSGKRITGMWIELHNPNGRIIKSGYAPISFSVLPGTRYVVSVSDGQDTVFTHWDNGNTNQYRTITPTHSVTLTAYYSTSTLTHNYHGNNDHERQD